MADENQRGHAKPVVIDGMDVFVDPRFEPVDLEAGVRFVLDPANAVETVHWARNYLYRVVLQTKSGPVDVVVKQFRNRGWRDRMRRRFDVTKAAKAWDMAHAFEAAGVSTARPVILAVTIDPKGPSYFVCEHLAGRLEFRYLARALNTGTAATEFPGLDTASALDAVGATAARMHDANLFHRDFSVGNVFLRPRADGTVGRDDVAVIDLNRARKRDRIGLSDRLRDLSRLNILRPEDHDRLLRAYWGPDATSTQLALGRLAQNVFRAKTSLKQGTKKISTGPLAASRPYGLHAHIPLPESGAGAKDRVVWDHLSDQPYQHAGRFAKTMARISDAPGLVRGLLRGVLAAPRVWARYRTLRGELWREPVAFDGIGIAISPLPESPEALLHAFDELGVKNVLMRLNPWQESHDEEAALAEALHARGCDITFALPQNRDLVRDPARWRAAVALLGERFSKWGSRFQVGQAVNRSKWGVWSEREWVTLVRGAAEALRPYGATLIGPAVIDFEMHASAALLNRPGLGVEFDALASLLYVDRRGAPENTQAGFDSLGKAMLARAVAETARWCGPRSWITEVNWPLWEGPHSPAGPKVSVDEERQADYLVRFYLWTLASGAAERVYWWQLVARGYGLMWQPTGGELTPRKSYAAFATMTRMLGGWNCTGPVATGVEGAHALRFVDAGGAERFAVWAVSGTPEIAMPGEVARIVELDGRETKPGDSRKVTLGGSVRYVDIANR
ncbi:MAG: lipopolysaccharide kinase InaA family protein [Thermoanaerobaculia bacterium]|jgi:tRNA A-37 threonylcarbamoyl transferase component Bud32